MAYVLRYARMNWGMPKTTQELLKNWKIIGRRGEEKDWRPRISSMYLGRQYRKKETSNILRTKATTFTKLR